ncbi:SDR family oxidoreductase [Paucibacter sp. XJ19-41]|uniref:SDR family oxidoreductase n=1 Tax=Paucibacter sp. XJ19-41 TaxID=2927824 RepID=UPI00300DC34D
MQLAYLALRYRDLMCCCSAIHADLYTNVPHFTGKHAVERMIESLELPVTVLRPAYFMQNDVQVKPVIEGHGVYPMPIGSAGVCMIDTRDIADVATAELLRRDKSPEPQPRLTLDLAGPDALTGESIARIWSEALGREIKYGGDDLDVFESQLAAFAPGWMAYDMRLMMAGIQQHGMHPAVGAALRLQALLGRPLRNYREAVREMIQLS